MNTPDSPGFAPVHLDPFHSIRSWEWTAARTAVHERLEDFALRTVAIADPRVQHAQVFSIFVNEILWQAARRDEQLQLRTEIVIQGRALWGLSCRMDLPDTRDDDRGRGILRRSFARHPEWLTQLITVPDMYPTRKEVCNLLASLPS